MENWTAIENDILDVLAKHRVITLEDVNPNFARILVEQFRIIRFVVQSIYHTKR